MSASARSVDAAVVYARRGWPVFPVHGPIPRQSGVVRCSCGHLDCASIGKHPRTRDGLKSATTDERQIHAWWARWPSAGVAIRTGRPSGLLVVDIDPAHDGTQSLRRLVADHGPLPPGRTIRTGSGGRHLYFAHPGTEVPNTAGRLGPGIDTRGDGGYVIAPPSRHASGSTYAVAKAGRDLPSAPTWIVEAIRPTTPSRITTRTEARDLSAWARAAVDGELRRLDRAPDGTRNDTLVRVSFRLGQIVGAGALPEWEIESLLIERGIGTGLREREVVGTVHRGLRAGEAVPRGPAREAERVEVPWP